MKHILILVSFVVLVSCGVQQRKYRPGYYFGSNTSKQKPEFKTLETHKRAATSIQTLHKEDKNKAPEANYQQTALQVCSENTEVKTKSETKSLPADSCDKIIFKDGNEMDVKVLKIDGGLIQYKRCDLPDGPLYTTDKSTVFMIRYVNGTKALFNEEIPVSPKKNTPERKALNYSKQKLHPKAILSVVFGVIGIFIGLGILAIVLGNNAIRDIENQPDKYKGYNLAKFGMVLGYIKLSVVLFILALAILLILFG